MRLWPWLVMGIWALGMSPWKDHLKKVVTNRLTRLYRRSLRRLCGRRLTRLCGVGINVR